MMLDALLPGMIMNNVSENDCENASDRLLKLIWLYAKKTLNFCMPFTVLIIALLIISQPSSAQWTSPLDSYYHPDEENKNEVYNNGQGSQTLVLIVYYPSDPGGSTTITLSPDPQGFGSQTFSDSDNDGYFVLDGLPSGSDRTQIPVPSNTYLEGTTYTISSSKGGSLAVNFDRTAPTITNYQIQNLTLPGVEAFKQGDSLRVTCTISDAPGSGNLQQTGIVANLYPLTGNGADTSVNPTSWSGGTATWNLVGGSVSDGNKSAPVTAVDLAGNQANATVTTIRADNTAPVAPTLLSPGNGVHVETRTPEFSWQDIDSGAGTDEVSYNLKVSTDSNFGSNVIDATINNSDPAGNTYLYTSATQLNYGTTYYWKVNAKDAVGLEGDYSSSRTLIIDSPTAPYITATVPLPNETGVDTGSAIETTFDQAMNTTATQGSFTLAKQPSGTQVSGTFSWSDGDKKMTFTPGSNLESLTTYKATVSTSAQSATGVNLQVTLSWYFTTQQIGITATGSITPNNVIPSSRNIYTLTVNPSFDSGAPGVDKVTVTLPGGHTYSAGDTSMSPAGTYNNVGATVIYTFNTTMDYSNQGTITLQFAAVSGTANGPDGVVFQALMDNSAGTNPIGVTAELSGSMTVVTSGIVTSSTGEINPHHILPSSQQWVTVTTNGTFGTSDAGVDKIKVKVPDTYSAESTSEVIIAGTTYAYVDVSPSNGQYTRSISGNTVEITLGNIISQTAPMYVKLKLNTPSTPDVSTGGANMLYQLGNSTLGAWDPSSAADCTAGDSDGVTNNSNLLNLECGYPLGTAMAEVIPLEVASNMTEEDFTVMVRPSLGVNNTGVDRFRIAMPTGFVPATLSTVSICDADTSISSYTLQYSAATIYPPSGTAYWFIDGHTVEVILADPVTLTTFSGLSEENVQFEIKASTPSSGGSYDVNVYCDSKFPEASSPMTASAGDVNGSSTGSLTIVSRAPASAAVSEIVPAYVSPSGNENFSLFIGLEIGATDSGVNEIEFTTSNLIPVSYTSTLVDNVIDPLWSSVMGPSGFTLTRTSALSTSCTVEVRVVLQKPASAGGPYTIVPRIDNTSVSNPQTCTTGHDVDGNIGNSETLSVKVGYAISPGQLKAELAVAPQADSNVTNSVTPQADISVYYGFKGTFLESDFGINVFEINVPEPFTSVDISSPSVAIDGVQQTIVSSSPEEGEARITHTAGTGDSGTVSVELGTLLNTAKPVVVSFAATSPVVTGGADITTTIPSWASFGLVEGRVDSTLGAVSQTLNGTANSITVTTMVMPATSLTATVSPSTIDIGSRSAVSVNATPVFSPSDTGVDMLQIFMSPTLTIDPQTITVTVAGTPQASPSILHGVYGASYEIRVFNITRLTPLSPGSIVVDFEVISPEYPENRGIYCQVDDTQDGKSRLVTASPTYLRVKGPAETANAGISPNETTHGESGSYDVALSLTFSGDETGVDTIAFTPPTGFTLDGATSTIVLQKDSATLSQPADYTVSTNGSDIIIALIATVDDDSDFIITMPLMAPSYTVSSDAAVKVSHSSVPLLVMDAEASTSGGLTVEAINVGINTDNTLLEAHGSSEMAKWKITAEVPFNSRMNLHFGTMKLNGFFKGVKSEFVDVNNYSVWRGYFLVSYDAMKSITGEVTLSFEEGRDTNGLKVGTLTAGGLYINGGAAVKAIWLPLVEYSPTAYKMRLGLLVHGTTDDHKSITASLVESAASSSAIDLTKPKIKSDRWGVVDIERVSDGSFEIQVTVVDSRDKIVKETIAFNMFKPSSAPGRLRAPDGMAEFIIPAGEGPFLTWSDKAHVKAAGDEAQNSVVSYHADETYLPEEELVPVEGALWRVAPARSVESGIQVVIDARKFSNAGLYQELEGEMKWLSQPDSDGYIRAVTSKTGSFSLMMDNVPPGTGEPLFTNRQVIVPIIEGGSGIDEKSFAVKINDMEVDASWNELNETVYINADMFTSDYQDNTLLMEFSDRGGNKTALRMPFRAPTATLLQNVNVYPIPAADELTFRFNSDAGSIRLFIHDSSGSIIQKLETSGLGTGTEIIWDLTDIDGREVDNGVYFWRLRAVEGADNAQMSGKAAVLR